LKGAASGLIEGTISTSPDETE